jgi:ABC-2 type transport system ATP-binding protein
MSAIAAMRGVSKTYGATMALQPTDLVLDAGVIGLLGPNGAGKSTLLSLLATVQPPSAGRIVVDGHEVTGSLAERTDARRCLGFLPQEVGFPRRMTAFGFLDYIAVLKEWRHTARRYDEVQRVLTLVGLADLGSKKIAALSGGQRRRLSIAQALIGSPRLVILDEPTTGLDPEQRASLRSLLSEQARTSAVLLATHQTEDVSALCDRVIVLDAGTICFDGPVTELVATAAGQVWVGNEPNLGAVTSWRTGTGAVRSIGGTPQPDSREVEPAVEDAYLLMRATSDTQQGALP